ncbi:hypothetical protein Pogu_0961 [Pyrobaculum oguniense TE7]|uniref:Uncharacterized protein n=1 Tax=Pyrobaculum oguniense (strain DSM 13380 / JCM 10595 / TE7) TaxID=698757 RepID=H6Q9T0_PYROT|nr:hypothetical protein Pogu_0961 [Pyrobaculum oguniense TE7]
MEFTRSNIFIWGGLLFILLGANIITESFLLGIAFMVVSYLFFALWFYTMCRAKGLLRVGCILGVVACTLLIIAALAPLVYVAILQICLAVGRVLFFISCVLAALPLIATRNKGFAIFIIFLGILVPLIHEIALVLLGATT